MANPSQESLKASVFQRLHPLAYFERFLAEKVRPDGRGFDAWRDAFVNVGSISTADGSALVRLGQTTIVCGVKAEIAEPDLDRPEEGFLGSSCPSTRWVTKVITLIQLASSEPRSACHMLS
jgi:exosome complex component RRP43